MGCCCCKIGHWCCKMGRCCCSSALRGKDEELKSVRQSSALREKDKELKSVRQRLSETEKKHQQHSSALREKDEELKSVRQRTPAKLAGLLKEDKKSTNIQDSETLGEMEIFYKKQLDEIRAALSKKEEELKSFKDRVAAEVGVSIKTGDTEGINSPVSKNRLIEMYHKLKLLQWPKIKNILKSNNLTPDFTKDLIQKKFEEATEEVGGKKKQIEEVFSLIESSSGLTPQKVKQYIQLANQNLQMSLYNSSKEDLLKTPLLKHQTQYSQDVMVKLRLLASECYWLGCLMALNNPPLQPDWQNHIPGMDPWDILPRDIKSS